MTRSRDREYHKLAKRMNIPLLLSRGNEIFLDREDMYRILRQQGIHTPDTITIRAKQPLKNNVLRDVWSTFHTPLMVRPLTRKKDSPSKLVKLFSDLEETVNNYHSRGIDLHILTYRKVPTSSIAVLPNFRNEKFYTPVWVETFSSISGIPDSSSPMRAHMNAPDFRKEQVKEFATKVYDALALSGPACIDIIPHNNNYVVVNVDTSPSLRKDGRFMQSLATTGVDMGQYIHSRILEDSK
jgi:D-alanine-D-alanine ligase-like ATP-grasp enzyme